MTPLASLTGSVTAAIADHGLWAVFVLMAVDALLPIGGELIMLYAGVLAAGVVTGAHVDLLGLTIGSGAAAFVALALAGALGYLLGAVVGWGLGRRGGRELLDRHGHWLHLSPGRVARAERWFARHGRHAVLLGRVTPLVRSFISVPAGAFGAPLVPYVALSLLGSLVWCFAFAAVGWGLGGSWESFHHAFKYVDVAAVLVVLGAAATIWRRSRRRVGVG